MKNNLLEQLIKVLKRLVCLNVLPCLLIKVFDGHRSPENIFPISEMITQYSSCSFNICMDNMG